MHFTGDVEIRCFNTDCGENNILPISYLDNNEIMIFYKKNIYSFYNIKTVYKKTTRLFYKYSNNIHESVIHTINEQLWKVNSKLIQTKDLKHGDILERDENDDSVEPRIITVIRVECGIYDCLYEINDIIYDYIILKDGLKAYNNIINNFLYDYKFDMKTYFIIAQDQNKDIKFIHKTSANFVKIYTHSNVIIVPCDIYVLIYENSAYQYKQAQNLKSNILIHKFMVKDNTYSIDQIVKIERCNKEECNFIIAREAGSRVGFADDIHSEFYCGNDNSYYNLNFEPNL
jgi:hypothetical protein